MQYNFIVSWKNESVKSSQSNRSIWIRKQAEFNMYVILSHWDYPSTAKLVRGDEYDDVVINVVVEDDDDDVNFPSSINEIF